MAVLYKCQLLVAFAFAVTAFCSASFGGGGTCDSDHLPGRYDLGECTSLEVFNAGDSPKLYGGFLSAPGSDLKAYADGRWTDIPGAPNNITALFAWNDGGGTDLYIGTIGVAKLYRWDGVTFTEMATMTLSGAGIPAILAIEFFDFGNVDSTGGLVIGGNFDIVNGFLADSAVFYNAGNGAWGPFTNVRGPVADFYSPITVPLTTGQTATLHMAANGGIDRVASNTGGAAVADHSHTGQTWAVEIVNGDIICGGDFGLHVPEGIYESTTGAVYCLAQLTPANCSGGTADLYIGGAFYSLGGRAGRGAALIRFGNLDTVDRWDNVCDTTGERINDIELFTENAAFGPSLYFAGEYEHNQFGVDSYDVVRYGDTISEPTILDATWELTNSLNLSSACAAHYSEVDDALYVGRRYTTYGQRGLYRLESDDTLTPVWVNDDIAGIDIDAAGNIYTTDDFSGEVFRVNHGSTTRSTWVSGWHTGDDDPVGIAIAPPTASGWFGPNDAFMVDRGSGGPDEIWRWSVSAAEGEVVAHADNGTLINAVDITCSKTDVWICDDGEATTGRIFRVQSDGTLVQLSLSQPINAPAAIEYNFARNTLYVLDGFADGGGNRLVRVNPSTGQVTTLIDGFQFPGTLEWASLDIAYDGSRMFITDGAVGRVYEFTSTLPCPPGDIDGDGAIELTDILTIASNAGCIGSSATCVGNVNGDNRTDIEDIAVAMSNYLNSCPDNNPGGSPSVAASIQLYETPWPEPAPDGGEYYTIDLKVSPSSGDTWIAAEAAATILGDGAFWEHPLGSFGPSPTLWNVPGLKNIQFDSFFSVPPDFNALVAIFGTTNVSSQLRDVTWFRDPDYSNAAAPFVIARYTLRLDDDETANGLFLTTTPSKDAVPYVTIEGDLLSFNGGDTRVPFAITVYAVHDCPADINDNDIISGADLVLLLNAYGINAGGDIDGDNDTDRDDLALFVEGWFCPDDPELAGGAVSHAVVAVDNTSGNAESPFQGGVIHFTHDLQIDMGDDYWTGTDCAAVLTEPGYTFFQHIFGTTYSPSAGLVTLFPSLAYDSFFTMPGVVLNGTQPTFVGPSGSSIIAQLRLWTAVPPHVGEGTIARFTIIAPNPIAGISVVPQGTAGANTLIIGSITGDSTVASTGITRHAFAYDLIIQLPPCPADLVGDDGIINVSDLFALLANWNTNGLGADLAPPTDIVNTSDLFALLAAWGTCP